MPHLAFLQPEYKKPLNYYWDHVQNTLQPEWQQHFTTATNKIIQSNNLKLMMTEDLCHEHKNTLITFLGTAFIINI